MQIEGPGSHVVAIGAFAVGRHLDATDVAVEHFAPALGVRFQGLQQPLYGLLDDGWVGNTWAASAARGRAERCCRT